MIGSVTNVLSINIIIRSKNFTGIFDPNNNPPTSDININWVTEVHAIINLVIAFGIVVAITEGINEEFIIDKILEDLQI